MKRLLISCILIFLSIDIIRADPDKTDHSECRDQLTNLHYFVQICVNKIYNHSELLDEFQKTLVQYSGDNDAVRTLADKYCPKVYQLLQCSLIGDAVDEECLYANALLINQQTYNRAKAVVDYVCDNNATAVLLRVLENNGLHTIYENKQFQKCLIFTKTVTKIDEKTLGPAAELCDGLDIAFQCYADYVRDHENKNLATMAHEINVNIRQAIQCSSTNEL